MRKIIFGVLISLLFLCNSAHATLRCDQVPLRINNDTEATVMGKCGSPAVIFNTKKVVNMESRIKHQKEQPEEKENTIGERSSREKHNKEHREKTIEVNAWTYYCRNRQWTLTFTGGTLTQIEQGPLLQGDVQRSACGNGPWD
jgi:hypothetical protein